MRIQCGDAGQLSHERAVLVEDRDGLRRRRDMLTGQLGAEQASLASARQDLEASQYIGIAQKYRNQVVSTKTTEMVNSDLDKYHKVIT